MAAVQIAPLIRGGRGRGAAGAGGRAHADVYPGELPGGQQQCGAIAWALTINPVVMRLNELTSALAPEMVSEALDVMVALAREGITLMAMLYEMGFAGTVVQRIVFVAAGEVVENATRDVFFKGVASARARAFLSETTLMH